MSKTGQHEHHFEVRYRNVGMKREVEERIVKCSECDQRVLVVYEDWAVRMTLIPEPEHITYTVRIVEASDETRRSLDEEVQANRG